MPQVKAASAVKAKPRTPATTVRKAPAVKKTAAKTTTTKKTLAKAATVKVAALEKKPKKQKVVRDSFTMPKPEYEHIARLKLQCITAGIAVKKSELLRAGLMALGRLNSADLVKAISALDTVKTGRPLSALSNGAAKTSKKRKKSKK
jgi:hypothetical protein